MKAIIYARWSSHEQKNGSTAIRQIELNEPFCERNGWPIIERVTDEGISAWTGDNIKSGALGKLVERLEKSGGEGLVLVVEKLDRLSRQPPLVMSSWLQRACATGLTIATSDGRHHITAHELLHNQFQILSVIFESFRGFEESQTKSGRVADAWARKRVRATAMTAQCPGWLRINQDRTAYELIEERAVIVRRIFADTDAGVGKFTIAARLNEDGVPVFGRGKGWHASYIQKITRNIAVLGDYQPHRKSRSDTHRKPEGDIIRGYFPAVISEDQFARVNDRRHTRLLATQRPGRMISNLFGSIARCGDCDGIMTYRAKGCAVRADGSLVREDYLVCDNALRRRGCANRLHFNYHAIQTSVLDKLLHLALDPVSFRQPDQCGALEGELAGLKRRLADDERRLANVWAMVEEDADDSNARTRYRTLKHEVRTLKAKVTDAELAVAEAKGGVEPGEHLRRVAEVRELLETDDVDLRYQARSRVKMALIDLIENMTFGQKGLVSVLLVDRMRRIGLRRDGSLIDDLNLRKMFAGELGDDGRFGPVTIREGGAKWIENVLTTEQEEAAQGYLRRSG